MHTYDALVIGGGIMGASTAYFLCKQKLGRVALLEQRTIASGATGKSAAIIRQHYSNDVTLQLVVRAVELFQGFDEELGGSCGFRPVGYAIIGGKDDEAAIRGVVAKQQNYPIRVTLISPQELKSLFPEINVEDATIAAHEEGSGYADPHGTVAALVNRARELGLELRQGCRVTGITVAGSAFEVEAGSERFSTHVVVNAAGPWAKGVAEALGVKLNLRLSREADTAFAAPSGFGRLMALSDPIQRSYYRPETGGLIVAGLGYPKEIEPCDPDHFKETVDEDVVETMTRKLTFRFPRMAEGRLVKGWCGVYAITDDWHPIVGGVPGLPRYYLAVGGSGHGFKLGPAIGESLAAIIAGDTPRVDVSPLRYTRFAEGKTFTSFYGAGNRA